MPTRVYVKTERGVEQFNVASCSVSFAVEDGVLVMRIDGKGKWVAAPGEWLRCWDEQYSDPDAEAVAEKEDEVFIERQQLREKVRVAQELAERSKRHMRVVIAVAVLLIALAAALLSK